MLIETPYKVGDVITIKLTSGEDLVGKFEADDDTGFAFKELKDIYDDLNRGF